MQAGGGKEDMRAKDSFRKPLRVRAVRVEAARAGNRTAEMTPEKKTKPTSDYALDDMVEAKYTQAKDTRWVETICNLKDEVGSLGHRLRHGERGRIHVFFLPQLLFDGREHPRGCSG